MRTVSLTSVLAVLLPQVLAFGNQDVAGGCSAPRLQHGRVRARGRARLVRFQCQLDYQLVGSRYATCRDGEWDVPPPVCARPGCRRLPPLEHGMAMLEHEGAIVNFVCLPGYQLSGPPMLYCDGRSWNASSPVCVDSRAPPATKCDFEAADWCGWRNDEYHDFDWRRFSKRTPSSFMNTGPSCDHTLGAGHAGHYLYVESTGRSPDDKARLLSPLYAPAAAQDGCFRFYYHMFGKTTGELRVFVKPITAELSSVLASQPLWSRAGNQGDKWYKGVVQLPSLHEDFQMVVEGVRGSSFTSDIAIDDVALLSPQECGALIAEDMTTTTTQAASAAPLDSCAGRCGTSELYSPRGDTYECSCSLACLADESCCADFRDLCIFADPENTTDENDAQRSNADAGPQTERLVAASTTSVANEAQTTPTTTTVATTPPPTTSTTKTTPSTTTIKTTPSTTTLSTTIKPLTTKTRIMTTTTQPKTTAKPSPTTDKASTTRIPTTVKLVTTDRSKTTLPPVTTSHSTATTTLKTTIKTTNTPRSATSSLVEKKDTADPTKSSHTSTGSGGAGRAAASICAALVAVAAAAAAVMVWRRRRQQQRSGNDEVRYLTTNDHCDIDATDDMIYLQT